MEKLENKWKEVMNHNFQYRSKIWKQLRERPREQIEKSKDELKTAREKFGPCISGEFQIQVDC